MALTITHPFVSAVADGPNAAKVRPSNWNATHSYSITTDLSPDTAGGATLGTSLLPWGASFFNGQMTVDITSTTNGVTGLIVNKNWASSASTNYMTTISSYGDAPRLLLRHANGTQAAPTQTLSGDAPGTFGYAGYTSAGAFATSAAIIAFATENFATGATGTDLYFLTSPVGSTLTTRMILTGAGVLSISGTTTSISTITGSLVNAGGFGNAGTAYIGGNTYFGGDVSIGINSFGTYPLQVYRDANGTRVIAVQNANAGTGARAGIRVLNDTSQYYELVMHSTTYTGFSSVALLNTSSTSVPIQMATGGSVRMTIAGSGAISFSSTAPVTLASSFARAVPVTETGTTHTVASTTTHLICNNSATVTVTLPTASSFSGREIYIKNIDGTATVVSASSNVVPRVGGAAGTAILATGDGNWAFLVSNGTNWEIMAGS
jgi:hypothetical protein